MNASILTIGDEILIGQIVDTNSTWIAQQLIEAGIWVIEKKAVGDQKDQIIFALEQSLVKADLLIITGGLGPTKDDITKETLAEFVGTTLSFHEPSWENLQRILAVFKRTPNDSHRVQCLMPDLAEILPNMVGTAPGMWFDFEGKVLVSLPGVPFEMKYLMQNEVLPRLKQRFSTDIILHKTIRTAGIGETDIATMIEPIETALPEFMSLAYLPDFGQVRVRLTARGQSTEALKSELDQYTEQITALLGKLVYGFDEETLEQAIGRRLLQQGKMLVTAESCTGGFIAHRFTQFAGASSYYQGGLVTYSNTLKVNLLGVSPATLEQHGAVSEATVKEMLVGALRSTQSDVGISISGIAGPDGGTAEKPVGTIWVAVGSATQIRTFELHLFKDRTKNIQFSSTFALNQLRLFLDEQGDKH